MDDVIALDPESNGWTWGMKYEILLVDSGDEAAAGAVSAGYLSSAAGGNAYFNYVFSLRVVLALKRVPPSPETLDLALFLARRGTELDDAPDARRFSNVASVFNLDQGFVILGIEAGDPIHEVQQFAKESNLPFPILLDPNNKSLIAFNNENLPSSYVIDRKGNVVLVWTGPINQVMLEKYVTPLLEQ